MYVLVILRGKPRDIKYKIIEDDYSTNAFVSDYEFTDKEDIEELGDLTDKEEDLINLAIGEAYAEHDYGPDC